MGKYLVVTLFLGRILHTVAGFIFVVWAKYIVIRVQDNLQPEVSDEAKSICSQDSLRLSKTLSCR